MALLQMVGEEDIGEGALQQYFEDLYTIVCISERPQTDDHPGRLVRTTYIVDWEQLVHLLEEYGGFGEDIVEVARLTGDQARLWRYGVQGHRRLARA